MDKKAISPNYNRTKIACYLGFITQAISANFIPLLFLKFHKDYQISFGMLAYIPTCFFITQLLIDLLCAKFVDRIGYRISIVTSEITAALGLVGLAFLPDLLPDPYIGIMVSVFMYAIGSGLIEVLCSPIIEACPFDNKEATMSLLHSFYCWGSVGTILVSTIFFVLFGMESWKWMALIWAIIPAINIYNFATCPIDHLVEEGKGMSIPELFKTPLFWIAICLMVCSGASEISMSQWASAYAESALGLDKTMGDLAGPCMFAVTMGICRMLYGKYGDKIDLKKFMIGSGILCVICYLMATIVANPIVNLIGCIVCGFSVAIMWPGTISISSKQFPRGGTAMFALLAMAGDLGGSIGPAIVGGVAQRAGDDIRAGMSVGLVFPFLLVVMLFSMKKK